jgi:hypothetical protein
MNGLPGLLGSTMPETYEMLLIIRYVKSAISKFNKSVSFPTEFATFLEVQSEALINFNRSPKDKVAEFNYWDASNVARESYR